MVEILKWYCLFGFALYAVLLCTEVFVQGVFRVVPKEVCSNAALAFGLIVLCLTVTLFWPWFILRSLWRYGKGERP